MGRRVPKDADLFGIVRQAARLTDQCLISFSGGKESLIALDLCAKHFKKVAAFHFYYVEGLSFVEQTLRRAEVRYGLKIHRMPHWAITGLLRNELFCLPIKHPDGCPRLTLADAEFAARKHAGIDWIASGHRKADSLERRGMLSHNKGIAFKHRRFYPLSEWPTKAVFAYLKLNNIQLPVDYRLFGRSWGAREIFRPETMAIVKRELPDDYRRIEAVFPFIEASQFRHQQAHDSTQQVSEVRDPAAAPAATQGSALQPA